MALVRLVTEKWLCGCRSMTWYLPRSSYFTLVSEEIGSEVVVPCGLWDHSNY